MLSKSEIEAILYLLDDSDEDIIQMVEQRLFSEGPEIVPVLEDYWTLNKDPLRAFRIETIIHNIQKQQLEQDFLAWLNSPDRDLFLGCTLVCRIHYPGLNQASMDAYLEKVRLDAWMAMYSAQNPIDKIQILNHILFERHGISGNTENYHSPENSFLNKVIDTRRGNPISLCNLYCIIAQRMGIPVFGVNLPQHFVLAYCEELNPEQNIPFNSKGQLNRSDYGRVLFYVNPYSKGQVFLQKNIDEFLTAIKVEPQESFYEPCDNLEIVRRMLRNLHFSYSELQSIEKQTLVQNYMKLLGMTGDSDSFIR
ncbi:MAG: transglutaminase family protein [Bacteroidetes bacterium]|nr:transglutaminase family protein [Bacteroidota bacterium]